MKTIKINDFDKTGCEFQRNAEEAILQHALDRPGAQTLRYQVNTRVLDDIWLRTKIPVDRDLDPISMRLHRGGRHEIIVELDDSVPDGEIRTPEHVFRAEAFKPTDTRSFMQADQDRAAERRAKMPDPLVAEVTSNATNRALRDALVEAIRECDLHNREYKHETPPAMLLRWQWIADGRALATSDKPSPPPESDLRNCPSCGARTAMWACEGCGAGYRIDELDCTMRCTACRAKRGLPPIATVRRAAQEAGDRYRVDGAPLMGHRLGGRGGVRNDPGHGCQSVS